MSEPTVQDDINIWLDNYEAPGGLSLHKMVEEMQSEFGITWQDAFHYYRLWL
jgi:hypothetical protein